MRFVIKNSSVPSKIPTISDLESGEIAINLHDKKLFTKDEHDNIIVLNEGNSITPTTIPEIDIMRMSLGII